MLSGERITSHIAAMGVDGAVRVHLVLRPDVLKVLFPTQQKKASNMLQWISESLEEHIRISQEIPSWDSPMTGFYVGSVYPALGTNIDAVVQNAIPLSASLASLSGATRSEEERENDHAISLLDLRSGIRRRAVELMPRLEDCFGKQVLVVQGSKKIDIDFIGRNLVANFGRLLPVALSRVLRDCKAQVLDLASIRDKSSLIASDEKYRMMVWCPDASDYPFKEKQIQNLNEAFLQLEGEGDKVGLRVEKYRSTNQMVEDICRFEVAA